MASLSFDGHVGHKIQLGSQSTHDVNSAFAMHFGRPCLIGPHMGHSNLPESSGDKAPLQDPTPADPLSKDFSSEFFYQSLYGSSFAMTISY